MKTLLVTDDTYGDYVRVGDGGEGHGAIKIITHLTCQQSYPTFNIDSALLLPAMRRQD